MTPFEAYQLYTALKLHFTTESYDFIKYHGKTSVKIDKFETRKDKYFFHKLSKHKTPSDLIVSNMIVGNHGWVGNLFNEDAESALREYLKRRQSLRYNFEQEVSQFENFDDALIVRDGQYPKLFVQYKRGSVSIETLAIFESVVKFSRYWDENMADPVSWPEVRLILKKYTPFIDFKKTLYNKILVDILG